MKLSTRSAYGIRALVELALAPGHGPISASLIAARQSLSIPYLEQLLHRLKNAKLVSSIRGPRGGYVLAKAPEDITMADVARTLEGDQGLWNTSDPPVGKEGRAARYDGVGGLVRARASNGSDRGGRPQPARRKRQNGSSEGDILQHAGHIASIVRRCVHERVVESLGQVTLKDLCEEVRRTEADALDHRYVFHI